MTEPTPRRWPSSARWRAGVARVEFGTPDGLTDDGGVGLLVDRVLPLIDRTADRIVNL